MKLLILIASANTVLIFTSFQRYLSKSRSSSSLAVFCEAQKQVMNALNYLIFVEILKHLQFYLGIYSVRALALLDIEYLWCNRNVSCNLFHQNGHLLVMHFFLRRSITQITFLSFKCLCEIPGNFWVTQNRIFVG